MYVMTFKTTKVKHCYLHFNSNIELYQPCRKVKFSLSVSQTTLEIKPFKPCYKVQFRLQLLQTIHGKLNSINKFNKD